MYPRNAASPEKIPIGPVVQISDGVVQTSGVTVRIIPTGVAEGDGAGTTAYSTDGVVLYTPTQAETNYASFILIAKKTGCIPASVMVVPTAESTAGKVSLGAAQTTDITGNLSGSVGSVVGHTPQTGDSYPIVSSGTHGNAALKSLIDAVDNFVDTEIADIQSRLPAALVSGRMDASVGAMASNVLTAAALAADAVAEIQAWNAAWDAEIAEAVHLCDSSTYGLTPATMGRMAHNGGAAAIDTTAAGTPSTTVIQLTDGSSVDNFYRDCTLYIDGGTGAGQSSPVLSYVGATKTITLDEAIAVAPSAGDRIVIRVGHVHPKSQIAESVRGEMDSNSTQLASIVADTNDLQADWANGGRLDLILDARASQSSLDSLDSDVAALAAFVDTEVAAILEDTGTTIPAQVAALLTTAGMEDYRADGATGSVFEILYELLALNGEFSISGTTKQHYRLDGATNAFASTLNDATNPTAITRA